MFEPCSRQEGEAILRPIMGDGASWYLDTVAGAVDRPQRANRLVEELTGQPAESVSQWSRPNAALFQA